MAIKLLVDSAADIGKEEAKRLGIEMIPMLITIGESDYFDGVDILPEQFYEKMSESSVLPKTSQVTAYRFKEAFDELTKNGDEVVCITISSKLSGTYSGASIAAHAYEGKVRVVDSLNACIGERLLCLYALQLIKDGYTMDEIIERLEEKKKKISVMAVIGTLEYLKKGGRISSAAAFAGELLSLKPLIALVDGEVKMIGKALGQRKGCMQLNKLVSAKKVDFTMPYGLVWSGLDKSLLEKYEKDILSLWKLEGTVPAYCLGATIGTHIGPGAVGVAFFEE